VLIRALANENVFELGPEEREKRKRYLSERSPQLRDLLDGADAISPVRISEFPLRIYRNPPAPADDGPQTPALLTLTLPVRHSPDGYAPNQFEAILVLCGGDVVVVLEGASPPIHQANAIFGGLLTREEWLGLRGPQSLPGYELEISHYLRTFCECISGDKGTFSILVEKNGPSAIPRLDGDITTAVYERAIEFDEERKKKLQAEIQSKPTARPISAVESAKETIEGLRESLTRIGKQTVALTALGVIVESVETSRDPSLGSEGEGAADNPDETNGAGPPAAQSGASDRNVAIAYGVVLYDRQLFVARFEIRGSGMVAMTDDDPVLLEGRAEWPIFEFRPPTAARTTSKALVMRRPKQLMTVNEVLDFFTRSPGKTLENVIVEGNLTTLHLLPDAARASAGATGQQAPSSNAGGWDWELPLKFQRCDFVGSISLDEVNLRRHFSMTDCRVLGFFSARNSKFLGDVTLQSCVIAGCDEGAPIDIKEWSGGTTGWYVPAGLDMRGSTVDGDLELSRTEIAGSATLRNCRIRGRARLAGIKVTPLIATAEEWGLNDGEIANTYDSWITAPPPADDHEKVRWFLRPAKPEGGQSSRGDGRQRAVLELTGLHVDGDLDLCSEERSDALSQGRWEPAIVLGLVVMRQAQIGGDTCLGGLVVSDFDPGAVAGLGRWDARAATRDHRQFASRLREQIVESFGSLPETDQDWAEQFQKLADPRLGLENLWFIWNELRPGGQAGKPPAWIARRLPAAVYQDNNFVGSGGKFRGQFTVSKRAHEISGAAWLCVLGDINLDNCTFDASCVLNGVMCAGGVKMYTSRFHAWVALTSHPNEVAIPLNKLLDLRSYVAGLKLSHWSKLQTFANTSWPQDTGREVLIESLAQRLGDGAAQPNSGYAGMITWIGDELNLVSSAVTSNANLDGVQCGGDISIGALEVGWLNAEPSIWWKSNLPDSGKLTFLPVRCSSLRANALVSKSFVRLGGIRVQGGGSEDKKSAMKAVTLESATCGADLSFSIGKSLGPTELRDMMIAAYYNPAYVRDALTDAIAWEFFRKPENYRTCVRGAIALTNATVIGRLDCSNCDIDKDLEIKDSRIGNDLRIAVQMPASRTPPDANGAVIEAPTIRTRCSAVNFEFLTIDGDLKLSGLEVRPPAASQSSRNGADQKLKGKLNARGVKVLGEVELCYPYDEASKVVGAAAFSEAIFEYAECKVFILPSNIDRAGGVGSGPDGANAWINLFGAKLDRLRVKWMPDDEAESSSLLNLQEARVLAWPDDSASANGIPASKAAAGSRAYSPGFIKLRDLFKRVSPFDSGTYASAENYLRSAGRSSEADALFRSMNRAQSRHRLGTTLNNGKRKLNPAEVVPMLAWAAMWGLVAALAGLLLQYAGVLSGSGMWQIAAIFGAAGAFVGMLWHFGLVSAFFQLLQRVGGELVGYGTRLPWLIGVWLAIFAAFYLGIGQHSLNTDLTFTHRPAETAQQDDAGKPPIPPDWAESLEPVWLSLSYAVPLFSLAIDEGRFDDFKSASLQSCTLVGFKAPWSSSAPVAGIQGPDVCSNATPPGYAWIAGSPRTWARIMRVLGWIFMGLALYGFQRMLTQLNRRQ